MNQGVFLDHNSFFEMIRGRSNSARSSPNSPLAPRPVPNGGDGAVGAVRPMSMMTADSFMTAEIPDTASVVTFKTAPPVSSALIGSALYEDNNSNNNNNDSASIYTSAATTTTTTAATTTTATIQLEQLINVEWPRSAEAIMQAMRDCLEEYQRTTDQWKQCTQRRQAAIHLLREDMQREPLHTAGESNAPHRVAPSERIQQLVTAAVNVESLRAALTDQTDRFLAQRLSEVGKGHADRMKDYAALKQKLLGWKVQLEKDSVAPVGSIKGSASTMLAMDKRYSALSYASDLSDSPSDVNSSNNINNNNELRPRSVSSSYYEDWLTHYSGANGKRNSSTVSSLLRGKAGSDTFTVSSDAVSATATATATGAPIAPRLMPKVSALARSEVQEETSSQMSFHLGTQSPAQVTRTTTTAQQQK